MTTCYSRAIRGQVRHRGKAQRVPVCEHWSFHEPLSLGTTGRPPTWAGHVRARRAGGGGRGWAGSRGPGTPGRRGPGGGPAGSRGRAGRCWWTRWRRTRSNSPWCVGGAGDGRAAMTRERAHVASPDAQRRATSLTGGARLRAADPPALPRRQALPPYRPAPPTAPSPSRPAGGAPSARGRRPPVCGS